MDFKCVYEFNALSAGGLEYEYFNGCKWSPDGSCVVSCTSNDVMHLFDTLDLCDGDLPPVASYIRPYISLKLSSAIYDYSWYPLMDRRDSATCFLATCRRDMPVQILDAFTGKVLASFLCYGTGDSVQSPVSVQFCRFTDALLCGSRRKIYFFDLVALQDSGEMVFSKKQAETHRSLISCIDFPIDHSPTFCCGSYDSTIGVYDYFTGEQEIFIDVKGDLDNFVKDSHCSGISQVKWLNDCQTILCSTRKCDWIISYDLRRPYKPLQLFKRPASTYQRICFSLDQNERHLYSASSDGYLRTWNLEGDEMFPTESYAFPLHFNSYTGCDIHPARDLLCTSSGERIYEPVGSEYIEKPNDRLTYDSRLDIWSIKWNEGADS